MLASNLDLKPKLVDVRAGHVQLVAIKCRNKNTLIREIDI